MGSSIDVSKDEMKKKNPLNIRLNDISIASNTSGNSDKNERNQRLLSNMSNILKRNSSFASMIKTEPQEMSPEKSRQIFIF